MMNLSHLQKEENTPDIYIDDLFLKYAESIFFHDHLILFDTYS